MKYRIQVIDGSDSWSDSWRDAIEATDLEAALDAAEEWAREGLDALEHTVWVDVSAHTTELDEDGDPIERRSIAIDPVEPRCAAIDGHECHKWIAGQARGNGGGIRITDRCSRCGLERRTDTWATRPDTGEQGLTSISYREDDWDDSEDNS